MSDYQHISPEVDLIVHRANSATTHRAIVLNRDVTEQRVGAGLIISPPVTTRCGARLKGVVVTQPSARPPTCQRCAKLAAEGRTS